MSEDKTKILGFEMGQLHHPDKVARRKQAHHHVDHGGLEDVNHKIAEQKAKFETILKEVEAFLPEVFEATEKLENVGAKAKIDERVLWKEIWKQLDERRGGLEHLLREFMKEEGLSPDIAPLHGKMRRYAEALKLPKDVDIARAQHYKKCLAFLYNLEAKLQRITQP